MSKKTRYHEFDGPQGGPCVCCGNPRLHWRHRLAAEINIEQGNRLPVARDYDDSVSWITPCARNSDDAGLLLDEDQIWS